MICIIGGGRDWEMTRQARDWLDWLGLKIPITVVLSGHSGRADMAGEHWATANGVPLRIFPPDWGLYGRGAGPKRNAEMVALAQAAIVFPGHKGTADLIQQARKRGLKLFLYETSHQPPKPGELGL
jgi:hypothetical protein